MVREGRYGAKGGVSPISPNLLVSPKTDNPGNEPESSILTEREHTVTNEAFNLIPLYDALLDQVADLDKRLEAAKGTIAVIQAKGLEAANSVKVLDLFNSDDTDKEYKAWLKEHSTLISLKPDKTLEAYISGLKNELDEAGELLKGLQKEWITHNTPKTETDALRTQRDELVKQANSFATVISSLDPEAAKALKPVPSAPTASRAGTTQKARTSRIRFFSVQGEQEDGKRKDYDDSFDISRIAFYQPFQCSSDELRNALKSAGWDGTLTTALPLTKVTTTAKPDKGGDTRTNWIGWDILPETEKTDEAPEADKTPEGDDENKSPEDDK